MENKWTKVADVLPEQGKPVDWLSPSGDQVNGGKRIGKLWFLPGESMYVYYTPQFWRYSKDAQ